MLLYSLCVCGCPHRLDAENSGQFVSGGSMGSGAMISTVFDDGSWVDMCEYLRIPTTRGKLYGTFELLFSLSKRSVRIRGFFT